MLISGIVSVLISVISFYFSAVLIVFALLFILLIVFLIIKRPKSVYILVSFFLLLSVTATLLTLSKAQNFLHLKINKRMPYLSLQIYLTQKTTIISPILKSAKAMF